MFIYNDNMHSKAIKAYSLLQKILFICLLIGYGVIVPLCFNYAYFDIMEVKNEVASIITFIMLPLAFIILILKIISKNCFKKNRLFIISLICFSFISLLSTLLSYDKASAFNGSQGWYIGSFMIISVSLFILALYDMKQINNKLYIPVLCAVGFVYVLTVLDTFNIDLFNFKEFVDDSIKHNYLSTIGNINWYVGYLSLTSLFFIASFIYETNKTRKIIFFIMSFLAIYNIGAIGSDGIYLSLMFSGFGFVPFVFSNIKRFKDLGVVVFLYSISLLILRLINYPLSGYSTYTVSLPFIIVCFVMSVVMYLLPNILKNKYTDNIKKTIIIIFESLLLLAVLSIIVVVLIKKDPTWGSGRYEIWSDSFNAYYFFSIKDKLIGQGPELVNNVYAGLSSFKGVIYQCSHSEPIQLLITTGIFGLLSWLMCYVSLLLPYFKNKLWNTNKAPLYISLFAYLGQSLVNSATTLNIVTLVLIVIIINMSKSN